MFMTAYPAACGYAAQTGDLNLEFIKEDTGIMRKELKSKAKARLRKCYGMFVALCLLAGLLKIDYTGSLSTVTSNIQSDSAFTDVTEEVFDRLISGNVKGGEEISEESGKTVTERQEKLGFIVMGHSRGILAGFVNSISTGGILVTVFNGISSLFHSKDAAHVIFIILSLLIWVAFELFFLNLVRVIFKRMFMEGRLYNRVPVKRFLFLYQTGAWWNVTKTLVLMNVYQLLWGLTIVGGFIKSYSYMLVPYIEAENPELKPKEAITLSRKMMDGHKWEAFVLNLSFILWELLDLVTWGLSGILFTNPYMEATLAEYYAHVRMLAKKAGIPGTEKLNDTWLYQYADEKMLNKAYSDYDPVWFEKELPKHYGIKAFFENVLGITLTYDEKERVYEEIMAKRFQMRDIHDAVQKEAYPLRLFTLSGKEKIKDVSSLHFDRHYSVTSLILIFFSMCLIGWLWEVSLHLIEDGVFVNRGIMHGPWLPIYGSGGLMILIILNKFRNNRIVQFILAVILCGVVEYFTHWYLELAHDGTKWWDYTGYFLNIGGRICAEGLLVFGLGGMAIVYFLGPVLDNQFRRIPIKIAVVICSILVLCFAVDMVYSSKHPNMGEGITDYDNVRIEQETETEVQASGFDRTY